MSKQGISRENHFSIEGIQKGYLFREKGKGLDNGTELPRTSPPSRGIATQSFMLLTKHVVRSVYLYSALVQFLSTIGICPM